MKVVHTHDNTGGLHIETPYPAELHLKDFFAIWGKAFNSTCIFDYCIDDKHELEFTVNSDPNNEYENLAFQDRDAIRIIYSEKQ